MDRISIFNYEAFYLDYLEGNLSEEETALLMAFFDANPDLRLDDEELPSFSGSDHVQLDDQWKNSLKQSSDDEAITVLNANQFLIAESEGLLASEKLEELNAFVAAHPEFIEDRKIYAIAHVEPDTSIVYEDKAGLKQEKARVIWFYYAAAAAASVLLFLWIWNSSGTVRELNENSVIVADDNVESNDEVNKEPSEIMEQQQNSPALFASDNSAMEPKSAGVDNLTTTKTTPIRKNPKEEVNTLSRQAPSPLISSVDPKELVPITPAVLPKSTNDNAQDVYASAKELKMSNPIEPITKFVSEKTNTQVDFQKTDKRSEEKGFYLKIGKFELSRKKH